MKFKVPKKPENLRERIICITFGTLIGIIVYIVFLYLHIEVFGWNFGLVFGPLLAGYAETMLARKMINTDTGAISAFIIFAITTFYSFILVNPTFGPNFLTLGISTIILQAAFPTLINYILLVILIGAVFYILRFVKNVITNIYIKIKRIVYKYILKKPFVEEKPRIIGSYDELGNNQLINSLNFIFITSTDVPDKQIINLGQFQSTVILEKEPELLDLNLKERETHKLRILKTGKDECLIELTNKIKAAGGNGVINLDIQYNLIGLGGDSYQISAMGMGVYIK
ncbi:MAG: hypothetical protein ACI389_06510 [Methanobrevibacter sp.]|uniref:hypothetical protein n=1 Tax=Methanobrevibacter sp. TaxID=66852 RepID=UPI003F1116F3